LGHHSGDVGGVFSVSRSVVVGSLSIVRLFTQKTYIFTSTECGDLLVSRPITAGESNPDDRDGVGKRDIYTFEDGASGLSSLASERAAGRIGFDYEFVSATECYRSGRFDQVLLAVLQVVLQMLQVLAVLQE
jgi:hypothetical protein